MKQLVALDSSMMGPEPSWNDPKTTLVKALNWYSYSFDKKDAKEFVIDYAKSVGRTKEEIAVLKSISEDKYNKQFGWIARMMCVGYQPDEKTKEFFAKAYKTLLASANISKKKNDTIQTKEVTEDDTIAPKVSIQSRIVDKAREEAGDIEGLIDDYITSGCKINIDIESYLKAKKLSSVVLKKLCDIFIPKAQEIQDVIDTKDAQIKEGYSNFTKVQLRKLKEFMNGIVSATNKGATENKPVRKARKKKEKSPAVLAAKVSYLAEDAETKLKSIHPEKIVGAKQVWVYNVKTRTLGVYNAEDARGLTIKGTTLQNFNAETSVGKRLRKPEVTLKEMMEAGKIKLKSVLSKLTTKESLLSGRINSDTIIARVEK